MNLIPILLWLVIVGMFLYVIEIIIPMDGRIKKIIELIVLIAVLYYLLQSFGLIHGPGIYIR